MAATRQAETIDRGFVALVQKDGAVYLGWRFLNTDTPATGFNIYRQTQDGQELRLNDKPIDKTTDFIDAKAPLDKANRWRVCAVVNGQEQSGNDSINLPANPPVRSYRAIPLQGDYVCNKVAIADLNDDGQYDYIIKQPGQVTDPGVWQKSVDTFKVEACLHDGTLLWRKDLGWNIEQGIWYSPMIVYDFDGDGRAEVCMKTAPTDVDYREKEASPLAGRALSGPEYCSVLDGMTGQELDRVDWIARGNSEDWGDAKGNRASRHLMGLAYLDGVHPSLLVIRGTYTLMRVDAWNLVDKKLVRVWSWSGNEENPPVRGQGMHGMHAVDLDGDGRDEIVLGSAVLDDNGKLLWNVGLGHPDACYVTDILPERPGLEIVYGIEPARKTNSICLADARTGTILWGSTHPTTHAHSRGMFGDFDPAHPGMELYIGEKDGSAFWTYGMDGKMLSNKDLGGLNPCPLYWAADTVKAYAVKGEIKRHEGQTYGRYEGNILAVADIIGDWREELITVVKGEVRIYSTTIPAVNRRVAFMQDPLYRLDVALVSMGYLYPPQLSYSMKPD